MILPTLRSVWVLLNRAALDRIRIYNNVFYNHPVVINNSAATFPVLEFRNNIVHYAGGTPFTENGKLTLHSNNSFFGRSTSVRSNGRCFSASNLVNYESSAIATDLQFTNPATLSTAFVGACGFDLAPNAAGFSLKPGSPGIDRGAALSSVYVGSINSMNRGAAWDIGAYETDAGVRPPAPTNLWVQ